MRDVSPGVPAPSRAGRSLRIGSLAVFPAAVLLSAATFREAPVPDARVRGLPEARVPAAGERVLVFAPHPDDEVLAVGGLIAAARKRGAEVRVAYLTSGDAFPMCAAAAYRRWPGPDALNRLALDRKDEARRALARLGLSAGAGTFLGYPDRGLAALWLERWSGAPYRSPYTGQERTAPEGAPYLGSAVLADVERLLRIHRPHFVYYPDPADDHPDHWAAHCFVRIALERQDGPRPHARSYLVHRGPWPRPLGDREALPLAPPTALEGLDARWERFDLSPDLLAAKRRALRAYATQTAVAGDFLAAFLRRNELLSHWPDGSALPTEGPAFGSGYFSPCPRGAMLLSSFEGTSWDECSSIGPRARGETDSAPGEPGSLRGRHCEERSDAAIPFGDALVPQPGSAGFLRVDRRFSAGRAAADATALARRGLPRSLRSLAMTARAEAGLDEVVTDSGEGLGVELLDSQSDRWGRARWGAVDFTMLEVESAGEGLRLRARLREPAAGWPEYRLHWKPLDGAGAGAPTQTYRVRGFRCRPAEARFRIRGAALEVTLPAARLGGARRIMVAAEAWAGPVLLDRTPWRVVVIASPAR